MKRDPSEKCMMEVSLLQPSSSGHQTRLHRAKQGCLLLCPFSERISIHLHVLRHRHVCVARVHMCPCVCACLQDIRHFLQKQEHPCALLFFIRSFSFILETVACRLRPPSPSCGPSARCRYVGAELYVPASLLGDVRPV